MVKDPICGKEVDTLRARAVGIFGGVTYYFCSPECKSKFQDPRKTPRDPPSPAAKTTNDPAAGANKLVVAREPQPEAHSEPAPASEAAAAGGEDRAPDGPRYAHSRVRRITGDVGVPVVDVDLSPDRKRAPKRDPSPSVEEDLNGLRDGGSRAWLLVALVMLIIAGGVLYFTLRQR
jgi:YHS domain-containing protein